MSVPIGGEADVTLDDYAQLVTRVHQLVASAVPEGATVAVVSRGDGELLRLGGRIGWHFPRTHSGVYAGHHPADDADAIARLELARQEGAGYLVLPAPSYWWLDHYAGFKHHLESRYTRIAERDGTALVFTLAGPAVSSAAPPDYVRDAMVRNVRALTLALLPPGSRVLVATRGDERLLDLGGLTGWHFPQGDGGRHSAAEPADGAAVVDHLEALRRAGAEYLVIPRTEHWWLERYAELRGHLRQTSTLVVHQQNVCSIFDLALAAPAVPKRSAKTLAGRRFHA